VADCRTRVLGRPILFTMLAASVARSIETLPDRFIGSPLTARYRLNVDDLATDVLVDARSCELSAPGDLCDAEISTDSRTWAAMDAGRLSGIEAFATRRLVIRGSIERSLHFEPSFERPERGGVRYALHMLPAGRCRISALVAGPRQAPPLLLIHGLGATKASWLTVVGRLAKHHRVIAVDLPGFGASSKPNAPYDARWFAERLLQMLDELGYSSAAVAGNSMGGRVAMEMGMRAPDRIDGIVCLCPATAFSNRPALALARVARPELGLLVGRLPRSHVMNGLRGLFADPSRLHHTWYEAAIDDFLATWRSPRARVAFFRALRHIYLDEPLGENGFWPRLSALQIPAMYVYGRHDILITHHFSKKVARHLPHAEVSVWRDCGHVPQIEFPERTSELMLDFLSRTTSAVERMEAG